MAKARKTSREPLSHMMILEDITAVISRSQDLQKALRSIVAIVAERMETEVCSLYLLDREKRRLTLCATMGLDPESVGKVSMAISEGLTGLVIERMSPVMVVDALLHPRYKYFPETGEERYHSFLGVPLLERKTPLGVLVVQTSRRREFSREEIRLLKAIAHQVSGIIVQARLLESLKDKERERREYQKRLFDALRRLRSYEGRRREGAGRAVVHKWRGRLTGLPVSPGFVRGTAYILKPRKDLSSIPEEKAKNPKREIDRFRRAVEKGIEQIKALRQRMGGLLPEREAALFDFYRLILEDRALIEEIEGLMRKEGYTAEYAVRRAFEKHIHALEQSEDEYFRDRATDVRDVAQRLLENLAGLEEEKPELPRGAVLVAEDLAPTDLSILEADHFCAVLLAGGGLTSHASILAKSFEIPSVVAVEGLIDAVRPGDSLLVDGNSGVVYINPSQEIVREYDRLERQYLAFSRELDEIRDLPAETLDGHRVALYANIGLLSDVALAQRHGAQGIGLYRTEIPFLSHLDFPSEEEQYDLYRRVVEGMAGKPVTIRTLDIGADKYPAYLRRPNPEPNPVLGWRSVRVSLEMVEIFKAQLRAILRVGAIGRVRLLIPMVSSLDELLKVKEILAEVKNELERAETPFDRHTELGIMIEVPSAVEMAHRLVREVDFISIGTNDLVQYLLAVDRSNPKVANLYEPLHPAVLQAIKRTIEAAKRNGVRVGMCGEMAANPLCTLPLLGMGLEEFSLGSLFIPVIKKIIRSVTYQAAKTSAEIVLRLDTVGEIKKYLFEQMRDLGMVELMEMYR